MITRQETFEGLYGAWRLFLRDRSVISLFDDSVGGFWKSFFAAVLILPIYAVLVIFGPIGVPSDRNILSILLIHAEFYVIGWVLWPLIMGHLAPAFDRDEKYVLYVVAFNWSAGIQAAILFIIFLLANLLGVSTALGTLVDLVVLIVLLTYHQFILRATLDVPAGPAFGLVIFEFVLSQIVLAVRNAALT